MKLIHVTIQTDKFDEEIAFYQQIVGLKITRDLREMGKNLVFLADEEGDTAIEIIETPEAAETGNEFISIGFRVDDVQNKRDELATKGLDPTQIISPAPNVQFFYVEDPAGVRVQFI